jgi:hypothetical protein
MLIKQVLLFVGVLLLAVHAQREETVSAGIITASRVVGGYRLLFLREFLRLVQDYPIPD